MKEMTFEEMKQVNGGADAIDCFAIGVTIGVSAAAGPLGWLGSATALALAYKMGCLG